MRWQGAARHAGRRLAVSVIMFAGAAGMASCGNSEPSSTSADVPRREDPNPFETLFVSFDESTIQSRPTLTSEELDAILARVTTPGRNDAVAASLLDSVGDVYELSPAATAATVSCQRLNHYQGLYEKPAAWALNELVSAATRHRVNLGQAADLIVGGVVAACPQWLPALTQALDRD
jgi:hypothetical protein